MAIRSKTALTLTALAAGLAITLSPVCQRFLCSRLPDTSWAPSIHLFVCPVGYLIETMVRIPLFTDTEFRTIPALTYVIALGGFADVVTESSQASFLWLNGSSA